MALAVCAMLNVFALAGQKGRMVEFSKDVKVGSTVVKRGTYKVTFDEQTKELLILSGDKVVARSAASMEARESNSRYTSVYSTVRDSDGADLLLRVNMGDKNAVIGAALAAVVP
jgi:hypothetical protein